jgi:hypothetical protein
MTRVLPTQQCAAQVTAENAAILTRAIVFAEPSGQPVLDLKMVADAHNAALRRMHGTLAPLVGEIQAVPERHVGWIRPHRQGRKSRMDPLASGRRAHREATGGSPGKSRVLLKVRQQPESAHFRRIALHRAATGNSSGLPWRLMPPAGPRGWDNRD